MQKEIKKNQILTCKLLKKLTRSNMPIEMLQGLYTKQDKKYTSLKADLK